MKCYRCNGSGVDDDNILCYRCVGKGEIELTNEEWLKSLPTEKLAGKLTDFSFWLVPTLQSDERREYIRSKIIDWLKEKHNEQTDSHDA